jgi:Rieske Fe-S protein
MADAPLSRRSFVVGGAVAVAAGIAGFFVAREKWSHATGSITSANGYGSPPAAAGVLLAPLSAVPTGGGIVLASKGVVLTRGGGNDVHGFSSICTHEGCTLAAVANGTIDCPCHGSRFNATTGAVVNGPATRPLPTVQIVLRGADIYRA